MFEQKDHNENTAGWIKQVWRKYEIFVENVTRGNEKTGSENIAYWRDRLFTKFVTWLLPICLVALVPCVYVGISGKYYFIAVFDLFSAFSIGIVSLSPQINQTFRKFFLFFMLYALAAVLLVYLGLLGPGFIYLLALSLFVALIFPGNYAWFSVFGNSLIIVACSLIIYLKLFESPLAKQLDLAAWIAVSSNLIFLSAVCVALISNTIKSLENTINMEFKLKNRLQMESVERIKNNQLLKESEGHYKSLFFNGPSPMWVLDNDSQQFLQVNEAAIRTYGYTNEEFLAMALDDIKIEEDILGFFEVIQENYKSGMSLVNINQHRRKGGEKFLVEVVFNPITFNGKEATLVVARDMTQQMNYINAIEDQNERLYEISYIQSHIVRAPLARIMGLVNLITINADEKPDPETLVYLNQSAKEFEEVIRAIIKKTERI